MAIMVVVDDANLKKLILRPTIVAEYFAKKVL